MGIRMEKRKNELREYIKNDKLLTQEINKTSKEIREKSAEMTLSTQYNDKEKYEIGKELLMKNANLMTTVKKRQNNKCTLIDKKRHFENIEDKDPELKDLLLKASIIEDTEESLDLLRDVQFSSLSYVLIKSGDYIINEIEKQNIIFEEQKEKLKKQQDIISTQQEELKKQRNELKEHDKNILNMMGIFLAIFSLIGINISFFASTFSNSSGKPIEVCEFLKYLLGVNVILVLAIMTVFELIRRYTKK